MSALQRLIEDYLLNEGWTGTPPDDARSLTQLRIWRDPEHPTAMPVGIPEAVRRVIRRERQRAGVATERMESP